MQGELSGSEAGEVRSCEAAGNQRSLLTGQLSFKTYFSRLCVSRYGIDGRASAGKAEERGERRRRARAAQSSGKAALLKMQHRKRSTFHLRLRFLALAPRTGDSAKGAVGREMKRAEHFEAASLRTSPE